MEGGYHHQIFPRDGSLCPRERPADAIEIPSESSASLARKGPTVTTEFSLGTALPAAKLPFRPITFSYGGRAAVAANGAGRRFAEEEGAAYGIKPYTKTR